MLMNVVAWLSKIISRLKLRQMKLPKLVNTFIWRLKLENAVCQPERDLLRVLHVLLMFSIGPRVVSQTFGGK